MKLVKLVTWSNWSNGQIVVKLVRVVKLGDVHYVVKFETSQI